MEYRASDRVELIKILDSQGVKLPPTTKLSESTLRARVVKAVDLSQAHTELLGTGRGLNLDKLKPWEKSENLTIAIAHCFPEDFEEAMSIEKVLGNLGAFDVVRTSIMLVADMYRVEGLSTL